MATKRKDNNNLTPQKIKALQESYRKQAESYKQKVGPLVRFLRKNKLKFNHAQVGNERIEYFRIDDFQKLIEEHNSEIQKDQQLNQLVKNAFTEFVFFKRPEGIKIKYPKALEPVQQISPDKKYASFRFDTTQSKRGMTILVIILVLTIVLFPIWPFTVKYALWWVSLVLLVVLCGIIVIRLILYLICVIFNYHIWIFPNLFFATGFFDSFIPVIQIAKGDSSWFNIFIRLFGLSAFVLFSLHIYMNPTFLDQTFQSTKETISDVHDWGISKINNEINFSQRALTNLDTILNETEQVELQSTIVENQIQNKDQVGLQSPIVEDLIQNREQEEEEQNEVGGQENL